jgi:DNA-binding NarL/FixJ family response regulator
MMKDILVAILEDDSFSRNWMALLMVRDWRTRLVGEFKNRAELCQYLNDYNPEFDVLVLDVDLFNEDFTLDDICQNLSESERKTKVLLTGIKPRADVMKQIHDDRICGYVMKGEVGYSLSWMITFAHQGNWVLTPGTLRLANQLNYPLPKDKLIVDGRKNLPGFTDHEAEVARFAFIFSSGRRELADELKISEQWSYGLISELYKKMGLTDIISGDADLFSYIGDSPIIRSHFEEIVDQLGTSKKAKDLETLAFHLITMPEIIH